MKEGGCVCAEQVHHQRKTLHTLQHVNRNINVIFILSGHVNSLLGMLFLSEQWHTPEYVVCVNTIIAGSLVKQLHQKTDLSEQKM